MTSAATEMDFCDGDAVLAPVSATWPNTLVSWVGHQVEERMNAMAIIRGKLVYPSNGKSVMYY